MADLKPIGSEKLNVDEKLKRILELTYYDNKNVGTVKRTSEYLSESKIGGVYGIVKEKDGYYVKRGLNESSLDYIGGMFMKNKNKFSSYAECLKRLELLKGQEELQEATKYVLKNKPKEEAPMASPTMDDTPPLPPAEGNDVPPLPPAESGDMPQLPPAEGESGEDMSQLPPSEEGKKSDYMAEAQKYAGKLGQELRDRRERMESDDIKYILNMIISAVDLDKLDEDDIEEIGKKFEREDEEGMDSEEIPSPEEESPLPSPEEDLGEVDGIDALEGFINSSIGDTNEIDLENYADLSDIDESSHDSEIKELDLEEIKKEINNSISNTLSKYFN